MKTGHIQENKNLVCRICHLLVRWFAEPISSTLKIEAICSSETSVGTQRTTRRHIKEDYTLRKLGKFRNVTLQ
jgi:hypothetical protein